MLVYQSPVIRTKREREIEREGGGREHELERERERAASQSPTEIALLARPYGQAAGQQPNAPPMLNDKVRVAI
jgi:hypothetical protein